MLSPETVTHAFTGSAGFRFSRWSVPIAPMVWGVDEGSLAILKSGVELMCDLTGHPMGPPDPKHGFNHVTVYCRDWSEIGELPDIGEGLDPLELSVRLKDSGAPNCIIFNTGIDGGIHRALHLVHMTDELADVPADILSLVNALMVHLNWSPGAFENGVTQPGPEGPQIRTELLQLVRAAYDPVIPVASDDPALAYRLAARTGGAA